MITKPVFISVLLIFGLLFCSKPADPPPGVILKYQKDAHRYCNAIVNCIKKDISDRLKSKPERRDMILSRMKRDLCIKNQYRLIGKLSVNPDPKKNTLPYDPALYKLYSECSLAVSSAADCTKRKEVHKTHPSCKKLRTIYSKN